MHLVIVHNPGQASDSILKLAFSCEQLRKYAFEKTFKIPAFKSNRFFLAIPEEWKTILNTSDSEILFYRDEIPASSILPQMHKEPWFVIINGRFNARADMRLLYAAMSHSDSDIVAVNVEPGLRAGSEKVHTDSQRNLYGFRLLYADAIQPVPVPSQWPCYLFIKPNIAKKLFCNRTIPVSFNEFINMCSSDSITIGGLNIGGTLQDLNTEKGLLSFLAGSLVEGSSRDGSSDSEIPAEARLFDNVILDQNVEFGKNTIIAGPAFIGDGARIADSAVIRASIIGPNVSVPSGCMIQNRVITDSSRIHHKSDTSEGNDNNVTDYFNLSEQGTIRSSFRVWPRFSYARFIKRIADVIVSFIVLVLFAPVLPVLALTVKLSSRGPVFFKGIRQGLHGKSFACVKFRTMLKGADTLQEKLRELNEADGPQFVMADDPRMSKVGRFLRETYIDEIPQFFAVLLGHMSIVGPRPSPESENIQCPFWRDARLSVKPGITGLWQVCRTRQPMKDFQEWIHYDVEYVRNLSMGLDLWICWKTFTKMVVSFVRQF